MTSSKVRGYNRRDFLSHASAIGTAGLLGLHHQPAAAEPPPETTRLRIMGGGSVASCVAPVYAAQEQLLHAEGFTDVRYLEYPSQTLKWPPEVLLSGEVDICLSFIPTDIIHIAAGHPVVILGGSHIGCVELVAKSHIRSTRDLKGKTVAISTDEQNFISMFAAYVGLDPQKDINWTVHPIPDVAPLFHEGKIDAFMTGPPVSFELRAKKIGHVLVSTTVDKPWSDYFCCLVASSREFVSKNPIATKRALRAILKAGDVCASEPKRIARLIADKGLGRYDYFLQTLQGLPYGKWRESDPESSLRFYALRMRELGMIKSGPQKIIAKGADWRFLNELKKELKA